MSVGEKNLLLGTIPEAYHVLDGPDLDWEPEGTLWTIGELHKEKVPRLEVLVEVMATVVEETRDPKSDEDPIPK